MSEQLQSLAVRCEQARYNASLGIRVESVAPDRVRIRVPFKDEIANPGRALHGGVAASTIDIAGALAAWTGYAPRADVESGTLDLSVTYLAAAIAEDIIATAEVLRRGKEIVYSDVDIRNDAGKRIAKGLVTYRIFDHAAAPQARGRQLHTPHDLPPAASAQRIPGASAFVGLGFIAQLGIGVSHAHGGQAVLHLPFNAQHADHGQAVHEGALAALIDTTGALASWSIVGLNLSYKASTVGIHVTYHAPAVGEDVVAHARTLRRNNEIFLNSVTVSGRTSGTIIATGSVTYRIVVSD
jgi:uncharacterized protein (TIGR00369 family)